MLSTKGADIRTACTKDTCIRNGLTYTSGACIGAWGAVIGDIHVGYAGGIDTVKCLGIYLQSSQSLELKQYSYVLEIRIKVD